MKKNKKIVVYITEDTYKQLKLEAEYKERSISAQVRKYIRNGLGWHNLSGTVTINAKDFESEDNEINITKEDAEYVYDVISNNCKTKDKLKKILN